MDHIANFGKFGALGVARLGHLMDDLFRIEHIAAKSSVLLKATKVADLGAEQSGLLEADGAV